MFYIRAGDSARTNRIPKRFNIYFKIGTNWDNRIHQFSQDQQYRRFDTVLDISGKSKVMIWTNGVPESAAVDTDNLLNELGFGGMRDLIGNLPREDMSSSEVDPY